MRRRVLVADDDPAAAELERLTLELDGYVVDVVHDGQTALDHVEAGSPDLVLLDVMMPVMDGLTALRHLRGRATTAGIPVLLLTARGLAAEKVEGLGAGADDYIVKPFDPEELLARVGATLRRTTEARAVSPLTGLPGNIRIEAEISARHAAGERYAVSHVDLDEFKSFNDAYGFLRGDRLLLALAACLTEAASGERPAVFVGHVGGDDFVVVSTPEQAERIGHRVVAGFDSQVRNHYDADDLGRGYLLTHDRRGQVQEHPLVAVSIGVAASRRHDTDQRSVVATAAEMKSYAKSRPGSLVVVDRRG